MSVEAEIIARDVKYVGGIQIPASAGAGKVLTSDASGNATWQTPSSGATDPSSIVYVSGAFNNTNNRYSSVVNALNGTSGAITIMIYSGTYELPSINGSNSRMVNFIALGEVTLQANSPTRLYGTFTFSGAGLTLGGYYLQFENSNAYFDCRRTDCGMLFASSNGYGYIKRICGAINVTAESYAQWIELHSLKIGDTSDVQMSLSANAQAKVIISAQYARMNISIANNIELIVSGGLFENYTDRLLYTSGSGYKASIKPLLGRTIYNGTSGGQTIAATGTGTVDVSNTKWESSTATGLFSGEQNAKINVAFCTVVNANPAASPFGSLGVANTDRALYGTGIF